MTGSVPTRFPKWGLIFPAALLFLAATVTVGVAVRSIFNQRSDSLVIDLAGRQRVLNQRHINQVLLTSGGREADYRATRQLFLETAAVLRDGGFVRAHGEDDTPRRVPRVEDLRIRDQLAAQVGLFENQVAVADRLLSLDANDTRHEERTEALLMLGEQVHVAADATVRLFDARSRGAIGSALRWMVACAVLVALMGIGLVARTIRVRRLQELADENDRNRQRANEELKRSIARFDLAVAGSTDGIWDWDVPTEQVYYAPRFKELLGYEDHEIPNEFESFRSRLHPDDLEPTLAAVQAHLDERVPYDVEYRLRTKPGDYRWFRARGQALWDEAGKPTRMAGSITDVNEQRRAEHLLAREAFRAKLLHQATMMAAETDEFNEALQHCVDTVCRMTGWPVGHVYLPDPAGRGLLVSIDVWFAENQEEFGPFTQVTGRTTFAPGIGLPGRIWESGEPAWIVNVQQDVNFPRSKLCDDVGVKGAFGFPIKIRGELVAVLEFFTRQEMREDPELLTMVRSLGEQVGRVLERKRAEAELRAAKDQAESANVAKSHFLANMSHELRTPLNSVIGFSNVLHKNKDGNLGATELSFLERIRDNGKHLLSLINDVLDISKIEADRLELEIESVRLDTMVRETLSLLEGETSEKGIRLQVDVPDRLEPVDADPLRLKQVLINLVGNAIKFTEEGVVTIRVASAAGTRQPERLEVIDTGIGIPPEKLDAVFSTFQQADTSTTRQYGGSGLGLAISRALCRMMGYDLTVESHEGEGSTFSINFGRRA